MKRPGWISKLLKQGYVAYSQAGSQSAARTIEKLLALGLVKIEVQKSRRRIVVLDTAQFARWVEANYPPLEVLSTAELGLRSQNIARRGDSKAGQSTHDIQPVLLKCFDPNPATPAAKLTARYGLLGLTSDRLNQLHLARPWWLLTVENWESFYTLAYPDPTTLIVALYLGGNVAEVTLAALAQLRPPPERVLHFGDYDWTGLTIFQRVQAVWPAAVLYIPANIKTFFQKKYGNRKLIEKQAATANFDLNHPSCRPIINLIAEYNAGLEQEIAAQPIETDFIQSSKLTEPS